MANLVTQPPFAPWITTKAFPLTGESSGTIQTGFMQWAPPYLPGYSSAAVIRYLYNPSTVSADYNIANASAQASLNFPNPGDSAMLAIPLSQTVQWSLMFDRTYEVWGMYNPDGTPSTINGVAGGLDASQIGVQVDVLAFMQFTGILSTYSYGTNGQGGIITAPTQVAQNYSTNQGIMQLVPCWAYFGSSNVTNQLMYYGYINEWSVQYTHWTQYNIPMRCVISVNFTMLPTPANQPQQKPVLGITAPGVSNPNAVIPFFNGTSPLTGVG